MVWRKSHRRGAAAGSARRVSAEKRKQILSACCIESFEPRILLSYPTLPSGIPSTVYNILSYGASDTSSNNATAIQNAINAAKNAGGGVVEIPAAAQPYLSGPITLASNIDFQVDSGAELQALPYSSYPNAGNTVTISNFISANNVSNLEITGPGTIDGNGSAWWTEYKSNSSIKRPFILQINNSNAILIQNITIQNSPQENVAFSSTNNVTANDVTISCAASSPNTDGFDPAGTNYFVENCTISTGDDDIAVKPESVACSNIIIENDTIDSGHGISIGGETNDGLNGMTVTNVTFNGTEYGLRLKAGRGNGGVVENISYSNITLTNVGTPIDITSWYENGSDTPPSNPSTASSDPVISTTPIWENITLSDITATYATNAPGYGSSEAGELYGLPEEHLSNIVFDDVNITANVGMELDFANNVSFGDGSKITAANGSDLFGTSSYATPYADTAVAETYSDQDIDSPGTAGTTLYDPDTGLWTVIGGGAGIGGSVDQFNLASIPVTGNVTYFAKVTSQSNSNAAAAAGVMIRESSSDTAAFADAVVTPSDGVEFQWRSSDGGTTGSASVASIAAPIWVEVVRNGSSFSAYYSSNGSTWTQIGSTETITMNSSALVGLAVSATNNSSTSTVSFSGMSGPTFSAAAAASPQPVTATSTALSISDTDTSGTGNLLYNWSATGPASVAFTGNTNDTNAAKSITANFTAAGLYDFTVAITDSLGITLSNVLYVLVDQTPTTLTVSPSTASLAGNATQQFTAATVDQFGNSIAPVAYTWSVASGGGSINVGTGLYTAPDTSGTATVKAVDGSASGTASVTIGPTVTTPAAANPSPVTATTTSLTVQGSEAGSGSGLTYTWSAAGPATVIYSTNGTTTSNDTTATFTKAGSYNFTVTITDSGGLMTTSSVGVTVSQTPTAVNVTPSSASGTVGSQIQYSATSADQFGNSISSPSFTWSVTGGGNSISNAGLVTLGSTAGTYTVKATDGSASGTASVTDGPTVATPASATPNPATGTTTALSVLGTENGSDSNLIYTWSAAGPATVTYSANGTNAAKNSTATFTEAGNYNFTVTITDSGGLMTTSNVAVTVQQTPTVVTITPPSASGTVGSNIQYSASATDQFGNTIASQTFTWSVTGSGNSVNSSGQVTLGSTAGTYTVKATDGAASGTASVTDGPTVATPASANPSPITGTTTTLSVLGTENGSDSNLTYSWSAAGPASVIYSANGTNAAKNSVATFSEAGSYDFTVTITDSGGLMTTSSVDVTVQQTPTSLTVTPSSTSTGEGGSAPFSAAVDDQFGNAISSPSLTWGITGSGNSINSSGLASLGSTPGTFTVTATDGAAQNTASVTVVAPPTLNTFQINDGNAQRAMIDSLTLVFSQQVTLQGNALTLDQYTSTNGSPNPMTFSLNSPDGGTTWVMTFTNPSYIGGSLPDGGYILTVTASDVSNAYNETLGGSNQTFSFSRMYGDFTGQGLVNAEDFSILASYFGQVLPSSLWYIDFNNTSLDNATDFSELGQRFGQTAIAPPNPNVMVAQLSQPAATPIAAVQTISTPAVTSEPPPTPAPPIVAPATVPAAPVIPERKPAPKPAAAVTRNEDATAGVSGSTINSDFTDRFFNQEDDHGKSVLDLD